MTKRILGAATALAVAAGLIAAAAPAGEGPPAGLHGALSIEVLSSPPDQVSGDDARVRVNVPAGVELSAVSVSLNGDDVTAAFAPDNRAPHALEAVLDRLPLGDSTIAASVPGPGKARSNRAELTITNHPITGPMFSGPHQPLFGCATVGDAARAELGPPIDLNCSRETRVGFWYRSTVGSWKPYTPGPRPADMATTTTMDGETVDFVIRWERGTINRFIYSIALLSPASQDAAEPDLSAWSGKAIFAFEGGVAIGHYQGRPSPDTMRQAQLLGLGYAVLNSTGLRTNTHYNLQLGGETAVMLKDRFVSAYDDPIYTVAVGGSGGAIQQYVYGQNHPGLIDGGVPQYSYPDMVTQTIHIGDCELLERWLDSKVLADPASRWRTWTERTLIEGLNASATQPNDYAPVMPWMPRPGSSECINGWRGLSPLALNPWFGSSPGLTPAENAQVKWTHWDDLVNIYGTDEHGYARVPWDNVGVQYGLGALQGGDLSPAEFLDLNANVGSWKDSHEMVQEGCPFFPPACATGDFDVWSARNMHLSPDGGATPAPRREGDRSAMHAAYRSGMVFDGRLEIPIVDWRHYLEDELDMHNSHQSFAARQRLLDHDGDASNQLIWFTDARPSRAADQTGQALALLDEWLTSMRAHPERGVAGNRPASAQDACFATDGSLIHAGPDAWDGILNDRPAGPCTERFQIYSTSRIVAGAPIRGGVFKCATKPVEWAAAQGLYAPWIPSAADVDRLKQIFPDGVCDYSQPDLGRPPGW